MTSRAKYVSRRSSLNRVWGWTCATAIAAAVLTAPVAGAALRERLKQGKERRELRTEASQRAEVHDPITGPGVQR